MNSPQPGLICWVELVSADHAAAVPFYNAVLGLTPSDDTPAFAFLRTAGADVGATYTLPEGPHGWMAYVADPNAAAAVDRAVGAGGSRVRGPSQIDEAGWSAVVMEPEGTPVGIWQAGKHPGFGVRDTVGSVCRVELHTRHPDEVGRFMMTTFGLTLTPGPGPGYRFLDAGDRPSIGLVGMRDHAAGAAPAWVVYFGVESVAATIRTAQTAGGTLAHGPVDSDTMGSFAVMQDPQGILFGILQAV
jgi:uncharacterized protein